MALTAVLFDLDDTLVSSGRIYAQMYYPLLEMLQSDLQFSLVELEQRAKELGITKNKHGRWDTGELCSALGQLEKYYSVLENFIEKEEVLYSQTIPTLKASRSLVGKVGIISNSMRRTVQAYANKYHLHRYIDFFFSSEDAESRKSDESYWNTLVHHKRLCPSETLVVGDNEVDDVITPGSLGFKTQLVHQPAELSLIPEIVKKFK